MLRALAVSGLLCAAAANTAGAQTFPDHAVRIIVPSPPGGVTDILARVIGQVLSQSWGRSVIIDNRPGADDMIGAAAVAKAAPDGYTLLVTSNGPVTSAPFLHTRMQYDPMRDLTPILMLAQITPVFNVPASSPAANIAEFIALAKSKPGELNYGSFGNGTYAHVAMEDFKLRTGTRIEHIPYKGSAPAVTALLQNEIASLIVNMGNIEGHARAGTIRILAAAGAKRSARRPDLPTIAESGLPGFSTGSWWGLFGPANLPAPAVAKIREGVALALRAPEALKLFDTATLEPMDMEPEQFARFIRDDLDNWGRQIKAAGITPD